MKLPLAYEAMFEKAERDFEAVLTRLGLTRDQLDSLLTNARAVGKLKKQNRPETRKQSRINSIGGIHV